MNAIIAANTRTTSLSVPKHQSERTISEHGMNTSTPPLEFLAFTLGREEYGIDIQKVQEIRGHEAVTRIANAPEFIKGVINLRGAIVPVVDMRIKFNIGTLSGTEMLSIIETAH